MNTTLVSASDLLASMQAAPPPIVLDTGFDLADSGAGARAYGQGHLPGAIYVHLERDLSGPKTGRNGRHPLPSRAGFAALAGLLGIAPGRQVVAYDRQGAIYAARLWWMLRWLGHEAVAVLDGGVAAWQAAGGALTDEVPAPAAAAPYPERAPLSTSIDTDALMARLGRTPLVDARAPARFRGEVEPLDPVAGHIPGALNRFYQDNLAPDGRFKSGRELRTEFEALAGTSAPGEVVHQCGSGVTACHNLLAMEHAGLAGSLLYPGSWSEWCSDPARPAACG